MVLSLIDWLDGSESCSEGSRLGYWGLILWTLIIIYLFVGVLFYANENPGPSTNCASAAFNMCVIIGCSIFFSGYSALPIRGYPFIRDCFFYAVAVIELYLFWEVISPGVIAWAESLSLVLSWCGYIVVLIYNNKVIKLCVNLMSWMGLTNAEEMLYEQLKNTKRDRSSSLSLLNVYCSDYDENEPLSLSQQTTTKQAAQQNNNESDIDDEEHCLHFMAMEMEEVDAEALKEKVNARPHSLRILRTAKDVKAESVGMTEIENEENKRESKGSMIWNGFLFPFHILFKYTIPKTMQSSSTPVLSASFVLVLVWLALLTFICVDSAEKMGNCLRISEDVMGLTLLAIGSSLPDCFSSILAAKQGKGEMAVSNALGSNVFDINICIGVSFLFKNIVSGSAIIVEHDQGFELFIAALFVLLALFMVAMFCYGLVLNKTIGAGLMAAYAVFLGAFCYLLQFD